MIRTVGQRRASNDGSMSVAVGGVMGTGSARVVSVGGRSGLE